MTVPNRNCFLCILLFKNGFVTAPVIVMGRKFTVHLTVAAPGKGPVRGTASHQFTGGYELIEPDVFRGYYGRKNYCFEMFLVWKYNL
mgnify:CR=1 FL=1